jgi:hypothetical protein
MIDPMLDRIRKLADHCAGMQGFLIFYGFGGGTAAGFGCLLLERLLTDSGKKSNFDFNVSSARQVSTTLVELSNCTLATSWMVNHSESAVTVDHWALREVSCGTLDAERRLTGTRTISSGRRLKDRWALRSSLPFCFAAVCACHIIESFNVILLTVCTTLCPSF